LNGSGTDANPVLVAVHDDVDVRELLAGDLRARFGAQYDVETHAGETDALAALQRHAADSRRVAVVLGGGATFLAEAHDLHPAARRVLMVGRGEWDKAHPAVAAMRSGLADSYIFVPWGPRERWLYLPISEFLADWEAQQPPAEVVRLVGEEWEPRAHALRDVFSRVGIPFGFYRVETAEGRDLLCQLGLDGGRLPVLAFRTGTVLVEPTYAELATALGFSTEPETDSCDLAIVGGGPAGLAAAVYAASEGLSTMLIEVELPGGQAGTSSRIRNYLGFPNGLSGRDLTNRAMEQAWFFGARFVLSRSATALRASGHEHVVELEGGRHVTARAVVLATGVAWRRLGVPSLEALQGAGVFYGASASDTAAVAGATVFVVGAGNSAGQAAVHLARSAASVTLLVRRDRLAESMSDYLVRELDLTPNVHVRLHAEVVEGRGGRRLAGLVLRDGRTGATETVAADALFVLIGAQPRTEWLQGAVARDEQGYVLTGADVAADREAGWPLDRPPMLLETSRPGVFAAGDVRRGSVKRVASAVGGGSIAVQLVHRRLVELTSMEQE